MEIIYHTVQNLNSKITLVFLLMLILACLKNDYNPGLIEYLRAEKDLRLRVNEPQGLNDSIKVLQQKYHIDSGKELARLKDNPDRWLKLIKALSIEK